MSVFLTIADSKISIRGIGIKYSFYGEFYHLYRLKSKWLTANKCISEIQYADDILICAISME